ncbi:MAG: zf-HC2 domain-containing protein [Acidobacteriia bacterium]|nr:zf-HC2 domain-containing protein [Terriglobia bacterium]
MTCKTLLTRMSRYIDGDLEEELCVQLKKHLRGCDRCKIVFDTTRRTIGFYRAGKPYEIPRGVHARLQRALRRQWKSSSQKKSSRA